MRWVVFILAIGAGLLAWAGPAKARTLGEVSWLTGCWRLQSEQGEITEIWTAPPLPALLGYSVTRTGGATTLWKQARIEVVHDNLVLFLMPDGRGPYRYVWTELNARREDAAHGHVAFDSSDPDRPQRFIYDRDGDQLTLTTVTGRRETRVAQVFHHIECPPEFP